MNSKIIVSILSLTFATGSLFANHHGGTKDNLPVSSTEQKALTPEAVLADL
jgi:hypothetical protein